MPMTKPTSEQVTFLAAGAGASQRTVLDKLRDVVSVKDFGAVGDGVADDTAAIQAAITALGANGGVVNLSPGTYRITSRINMNTRCILRGVGGGETTGAIGAVVVLKAATMTTEAILISSACCRIENIVVSGEAGNTGNGITIQGNAGGVSNCAVSTMGGIGIRIGEDSGSINCNSWSLRDVTCRNNGSHGIYIHSSSNNANAGVAVRVNCSNNSGDGIRNKLADKNTYVGCLTESNTGYGWHFLNDSNHIAANTVIGGDTEGNTAGNVFVNTHSWYNTFINPGILEDTATFTKNTTVINPAYGRNRFVSGGTEEWFSNGPVGGSGAADTTEYMSVYDQSAERVRFGYVVKDTVIQGLVPSQFMHDNYGACMASRAVNYGSCRFAAGIGPAIRGGFYGLDGTFWIGPGPTNSNALHVFFQSNIASGWNAAAAGAYIGKDSTTSRSINAAGTLNASGTDYAEYMFKADPSVTIPKGAICGVDINGKLTTRFADSITFVVKSTNPSYVGGDTWATESVIGKAPESPVPPRPFAKEPRKETADNPHTELEIQAFVQEHDEWGSAEAFRWEMDLRAFEEAQREYAARVEAERVKVDRIAFSGQVPVNVTSAGVGDYIVPQAAGAGIVGVAVPESAITFSQYRSAVGRVISIGADGRPNIIVKVA